MARTGIKALEVRALAELRGELDEGLRRVRDAMLRREAEQQGLAPGKLLGDTGFGTEQVLRVSH